MSAIFNLSPEQRLEADPMTPKQYGMITAETAKLGWTWAEVALFAHLHVGYPYYEITREIPMSLTKAEAWALCKFLSATPVIQANDYFAKLLAHNPPAFNEWQQHWDGRDEERGTKLTPPVQRECPECHRCYDQEHANFCVVDGTRLRDLGVCTECGERLSKPTAKFCSECGADQHGDSFVEKKDSGVLNGSNIVPFPLSNLVRPSVEQGNLGDDPFADEDLDGPF